MSTIDLSVVRIEALHRTRAKQQCPETQLLNVKYSEAYISYSPSVVACCDATHTSDGHSLSFSWQRWHVTKKNARLWLLSATPVT